MENQKIRKNILEIYTTSQKRTGPAKIQRMLSRDYGLHISIGRVYRLMKTMNLPKMSTSALCNEIRNENIRFDCKYTVQEDISYLSTGLTLKDIGKEVSIKELLSLMLLASDNSAMDIVIRLIGISKIEKYSVYM